MTDRGQIKERDLPDDLCERVEERGRRMAAGGVSPFALDARRLVDAYRAMEKERDEVRSDRDNLREMLHDLVLLDSEYNNLNGGGPNWPARWEEAMRRAAEPFLP